VQELLWAEAAPTIVTAAALLLRSLTQTVVALWSLHAGPASHRHAINLLRALRNRAPRSVPPAGRSGARPPGWGTSIELLRLVESGHITAAQARRALEARAIPPQQHPEAEARELATRHRLIE
jgi:hypothetical protein